MILRLTFSASKTTQYIGSEKKKMPTFRTSRELRKEQKKKKRWEYTVAFGRVFEFYAGPLVWKPLVGGGGEYQQCASSAVGRPVARDFPAKIPALRRAVGQRPSEPVANPNPIHNVVVVVPRRGIRSFGRLCTTPVTIRLLGTVSGGFVLASERWSCLARIAATPLRVPRIPPPARRSVLTDKNGTRNRIRPLFFELRAAERLVTVREHTFAGPPSSSSLNGV